MCDTNFVWQNECMKMLPSECFQYYDRNKMLTNKKVKK